MTLHINQSDAGGGGGDVVGAEYRAHAERRSWSADRVGASSNHNAVHRAPRPEPIAHVWARRDRFEPSGVDAFERFGPIDLWRVLRSANEQERRAEAIASAMHAIRFASGDVASPAGRLNAEGARVGSGEAIGSNTGAPKLGEVPAPSRESRGSTDGNAADGPAQRAYRVWTDERRPAPGRLDLMG